MTFRLVRFLLYVVVCFALSPGAVYSQTSEPIVLEGLSFNCPSCTKLSDRECQVPKGNLQILVACDEVVDHLLQEVATVSSGEQLPTDSQIVDYLVRSRQRYQRAKRLIEISVRRGDASGELARRMSHLVRLYPEIWDEVVTNLTLSERLSEELWKAAATLDTDQGFRIQAVLAARSSKLGLGDLLSFLSISDVRRDQSRLRILREKLSYLVNPWSKDLEKVEQFIDECILQDVLPNSPRCSNVDSLVIDQSAKTYLNRIRVQNVLKRVEDNSLDLNIKLELLSHIPYEEYRTPEVHRVLGTLLREIDSDQSRVDWDLLKSSRIGEMLVAFAANDQELLPIIDRVVSRARPVPAEADGQEYQRAALARERSRGVDRERPWFFLPIAIFCLIGSCLGAAYVVSKRMEVPAETNRSILTFAETTEFNFLREYFGLFSGASEDDLKRSYRAKARELHPDVSGGDADSFAALHERYRRCQNLMEEIKIRSRRI